MVLDLSFWALTLDFAGKILLGVTALMVHARVKKERKIDIYVLKKMELEKFFGILAISLIVASYTLSV